MESTLELSYGYLTTLAITVGMFVGLCCLWVVSMSGVGRFQLKHHTTCIVACFILTFIPLGGYAAVLVALYFFKIANADIDL